MNQIIGFLPDYRKAVIAAARSAGPMMFKTFVDGLPADEFGRFPTSTTVHKWLKAAHVRIPKPCEEEWPAEIKAEALELVMGECLPIRTAIKRLRDRHNAAPNFASIRSWLPAGFQPISVREHNEQGRGGDSWAESQKYADSLPPGTSQAARDQALLAAWIPECNSFTPKDAKAFDKALRKYDWTKRRRRAVVDDEPTAADLAGDDDGGAEWREAA